MEEEQKRKQEEEKRKKEEKEKKMINSQHHTIVPGSDGNQIKNPSTPNAEADISGSGGGGGSKPADTSYPVTTKPLKKNFASLDCGAKVLSANAEAQSPGNIISSHRDEYMLNKCENRAWFVVELCESIKALRMELANFELYSSVPHEFRVWLVNSFPAREKDWVLFGHFYAEDVRDVQTFHSKEGVFGKYAKVEILSSHGSEHYCPISQFRIFGISEIELIDEDEEPEEDDGYVANLEDVVASTTAPPAPAVNIVSYIKEKVGATIERVVGVFSPRDQTNVDMNVALNETSLVGNSFKYVVACPDCDVERYRDVYFLLATNFDHLLAAMTANPILRGSLGNGLCQSHGFDWNGIFAAVAANSSRCVGYRTMEFYRTLFGSSRTIALCNILSAEKGLLKRATSNQAFRPTSINHEDRTASAASAADAAGHSTEDAASNTTSDDTSATAAEAAAGKDVSASNVGDQGGSDVSQDSDSKGTKTAANIGGNNATVEDALPSGGDQTKTHQPVEPTQVSSDIAGKENPSSLSGGTGKLDSSPSAASHHTSEEHSKTDRPSSSGAVSADGAQSSVAADDEDNGRVTSHNKNEDVLKDPPTVVHVTPSTAAHISSPSSVSANGNGGGGGAPRESVWQKLSNKIKVHRRRERDYLIAPISNIVFLLGLGAQCNIEQRLPRRVECFVQEAD